MVMKKHQEKKCNVLFEKGCFLKSKIIFDDNVRGPVVLYSKKKFSVSMLMVYIIYLRDEHTKIVHLKLLEPWCSGYYYYKTSFN